MKRHLGILQTFSIVSLLATSLSGSETLRLRADTWMPFNGDPAGNQPGYTIEIARIICARNKITLDYQNMPWGDALKAAAANQIEAVVGASKEEAAALVVPQSAIGVTRTALIVLKDNPWHYGNLTSLQNLRLAVIQDYKYWRALDDYIAKNAAPRIAKLSGDHPLQDALGLLRDAKVDVVAETASVFIWANKTGGYPAGTFRIAYLHEGDPAYIAFAPSAAGKRYAAMFDEGIRLLRTSGELREILARYGLEDWE